MDQAPGDASRAGALFGLSKLKTTGRIGRKNRPNGPHREVPIKVTTWVDVGVVPLVRALNELPNVTTLASCQGDPGRRPASVFFRYRGDARQAMLWVATLAVALAPHEAAADYTLTAEWRSGADEPIFQLTCPSTQTDGLALAVVRGQLGLGISA